MKTNGMTSAAYALRYWERRQEIAANNLANVNTDGFKAERVFARALGDALPVADTMTDRRAGTLRPTGSPLDLALDGPGFLVVQTENGERLSRGGAYRLDEQGRIVDAGGNALLGEAGPIVAPQGTIEIDEAGVVKVDGKEVDRLRMENVPLDAELVHEGGTLFVPPAEREPAENLAVRQGFLEDSNVGTVESMVEMIDIQRSYAAVQKVMVTLDQIRHTISSELGKPA